MRLRCMIALLCAAAALPAQEEPALARVLARLDAMERENQHLAEEVKALRQELAALKPAAHAEGPAPLEERLAVQEQRTEELAQTKVETSQKSPVSLTGMLLFNAFLNGKNAGASQYPVSAPPAAAPRPSGASLRQTVLGLTFEGPALPGNGKVSGSLYMDFFSGSALPENHILHIRNATVDLNWRNTTVTIGQDKPVIAPREPDSLAQVGVSPLTAAGNLWDWQPQARVEQRFHLGEHSGVRAQAGVYQTQELETNVAAPVSATLERARPGYEGRFEFWHHSGTRRFELAPGFHASDTHVAGSTVPSRIFSFDGLVRPARQWELTGAFFRGRNVTPLGALRPGFVIDAEGKARPVHSTGGWGQLAFFATSRLMVHVYGGQQWNRPEDLRAAAPQRNFVYAANLFYRLAPSILASVEASQTRTNYVNQGLRLNNHYDVALAYLF